MQDILVHSLIAFVLCPGLVYVAVRAVHRYGDTRSPKVWIAIASGAYGILSMVMGMTQGARVGGDLGSLVGWRDPWMALLQGAAVSLALSFWMLLVAKARFHGHWDGVSNT